MRIYIYICVCICIYVYICMYNTLYGKWIAPPLGLTEHRLGAPLAQLAATSPGTPAGLQGSKAIQSQSQSHHKTKADLESWSSSVCVCTAVLLVLNTWDSCYCLSNTRTGRVPPPTLAFRVHSRFMVSSFVMLFMWCLWCHGTFHINQPH